MSILSSTNTGSYSRIYINGIHDYIAYKYATLYTNYLYAGVIRDEIEISLKTTIHHRKSPGSTDRIYNIVINLKDGLYKKLSKKNELKAFVDIYKDGTLRLIGDSVRKLLDKDNITDINNIEFSIMGDAVYDKWLEKTKSKKNYV